MQVSYWFFFSYNGLRYKNSTKDIIWKKKYLTLKDNMEFIPSSLSYEKRAMEGL